MKKNIENMTMPEIINELNAIADKYNMTSDDAERLECVNTAKQCCDKYNELSMLTAYASFVADAQPIVAIAKAYNYSTVSAPAKPVTDVINGKTVVMMKMSIKTDGVKTHNLVKFLEWAESHNKKLTAAPTWRTAMNTARNTINGEWEKYLTSDDGYKMSKTAIKKAVQALFDAFVFIKAENSDKNAVVANGDIANFVLALAAKCEKSIDNGEVKFTLEFLGKKTWQTIVFDILHMAVNGKSYDVVYGEPEETAEEAEAEETEEA